MRIDDALKTMPSLSTAETKKGISNAASTASSSINNFADSKTQSIKSDQLKSIELSIADSNVFNGAKVAEIKSRIDSGEYKVNPGDITDGLILSMKDFLNTQLSNK